MSFEQRIKNVIVANANNALAAAGQSVDSLADETLAYVELDTGLTTLDLSKPGYFFIKHGADYVKSDFIRGIDAARKIAYKQASPQITDVTGFEKAGCCEKPVVLKLDLSSTEILKIHGSKTPYWRTYVSNPCGTCEQTDQNDVVKDLIDQINSDDSNFVTAVPIEFDSVNNTWNEITDWDAFYNTNHAANTDADPNNDVVAGIRIQSDLRVINEFCDALNIYFYPRIVQFDVVVPEDCDCEGLVITEVQKAEPGSGEGIDVKFLEGFARHWQGRSPSLPFSNIANGMVRTKPLYADEGTNYTTYVIDFHDNTPVGWTNRYYHNKTLYIFVPVGNSTTEGSLDAVLNV